MACKYHYDITNEALTQPAKDKTPEDFFVDWTAADKGNIPMLCAELCRLAYGGKDLVRFTLPRAGMKLVDWMGGEDIPDRYKTWGTDGFVALDRNGQVFVVFRGTEPGKAEDIIADLRIKAVHWWQGGLVHEGFNAAYLAIQDQLQKTLKLYGGKLVCAGHSLGGAVATLAAADHKDRNPELMTFGCPRVGDQAFVTQLAGQVKPSRYVNCCDVVARVPPEVIDKAHLNDLMGCFLWSTVGLGHVEEVVAGLVGEVAGHPVYTHLGDTRYIDQAGNVTSTVDIAADQAAARKAYPPQVQLNVSAYPADGWATGLYDSIK
ncbi:MAG: hypothetical protein RIR00_2302, partial [Pseudomonadota bacterium]